MAFYSVSVWYLISPLLQLIITQSEDVESHIVTWHALLCALTTLVQWYFYTICGSQTEQGVQGLKTARMVEGWETSSNILTLSMSRLLSSISKGMGPYLLTDVSFSLDANECHVFIMDIFTKI